MWHNHHLTAIKSTPVSSNNNLLTTDDHLPQSKKIHYSNFTQKVRDSMCSGVEEQIYTPRLWYYDLLSFLDERNINTRDGTDTMQEEDVDINDSFMESQEMRHISKRKREEQKNREELITLTKKLITSKPDQWDGLAIAYTEQLRELQPQQQAIAQKLISEVICFGKLGLLSTQSTVILPAQPHSFPVIQTSVVPVPSTPSVTHIPTLAPVPSPSPVSHILSSSSTNTQPSPCLSSTINTYNTE
ncbi:uncharacterized protein LOC124711888 [Schistocerca piceifrons]|uniref:uncharacterized protein LOC124711888 n=1 Tax=Schistocerca piceifrons TaxID=274613 RepID=UPI001F5FA91C|nr:uncharacterized protein LOC124711888 [Schistocerca piceifrons]